MTMKEFDDAWRTSIQGLWPRMPNNETMRRKVYRILKAADYTATEVLRGIERYAEERDPSVPKWHDCASFVCEQRAAHFAPVGWLSQQEAYIQEIVQALRNAHGKAVDNVTDEELYGRWRRCEADRRARYTKDRDDSWIDEALERETLTPHPSRENWNVFRRLAKRFVDTSSRPVRDVRVHVRPVPPAALPVSPVMALGPDPAPRLPSGDDIPF